MTPNTPLDSAAIIQFSCRQEKVFGIIYRSRLSRGHGRFARSRPLGSRRSRWISVRRACDGLVSGVRVFRKDLVPTVHLARSPSGSLVSLRNRLLGACIMR